MPNVTGATGNTGSPDASGDKRTEQVGVGMFAFRHPHAGPYPCTRDTRAKRRRTDRQLPDFARTGPNTTRDTRDAGPCPAQPGTQAPAGTATGE